MTAFQVVEGRHFCLISFENRQKSQDRLYEASFCQSTLFAADVVPATVAADLFALAGIYHMLFYKLYKLLVGNLCSILKAASFKNFTVIPLHLVFSGAGSRFIIRTILADHVGAACKSDRLVWLFFTLSYNPSHVVGKIFTVSLAFIKLKTHSMMGP
jgi:hypothetical protein